MSTWTIFGVGLFVTLLVAAGLFFTVLEFRDIERHPEDHQPKSFPDARTRMPAVNKTERLIAET